MIRLIASDLDGTLIDTHNQCDPSVPAAIERYRRLGAKFAVCSGRPIDSVLPLLEGWGLKGAADYIIGSNGGEVLETATGKRQTVYTLEPELMREIIDIYEPMGLISTLYDGTTLYVSQKNSLTDYIAKRIGVEAIAADVRALTVKPELKVMFIVDPSRMKEVEAYAKSHPDPRYNAFKTAVDLFEFSNPLLAKDVGVRIVGNMMRCGPESMLAFGDTTNDIEMLEYVRYGIAMENGSDDAKRVAYAIAPSVDDNGFAKYLEAHLSDRLEMI